MFAIQWPLVLFSLVAGMGGCTIATAGVSSLAGKGTRRAQLVAAVVGMVMLVVGGFLSMLHLAVPRNVMAAATNIFSFSGISIELILLGITFVAALAYAILVQRQVAGGAVKAVAVIAVVAGLLLAFFCGHGYVMPGRPLWDTQLIPIAYFGTALAAGAFLFAVIQLSCGDEDGNAKALGWVYVAAGVVIVLAVAAYVAFLASKGALTDNVLVYGVLALVGAAVALVCGVCMRRAKGSLLGIALAGCVVAAAAGLLVRMQMWATSAGFVDLFGVAESTRMWFF